MPRPLRLVHTGLILILVPFVFEVAFVAALAYSLHEAYLQTEAERNANQLLVHTNLLSRAFEDSGVALFGYEKTKADIFFQKYKEVSQNLAPELRTIKSYALNRPQQQEAFQKVEQDCHSALRILDKTYTIITTNEDDVAKFRVENNYKELKNILSDLQSHVATLTEEEQKMRDQSQSIQQGLKQNISTILAIGLLTNFLVACAMAIFFGKGFAKRLGVLKDNSTRLASAKPLNPPLQSGDEIAEVDRTFHQMTEALADAARKERAIVENAVDVICSIDDDGKFIEVSPSCAAAWGYAPSDLIGKRYISIVHEDSAKKTLAVLQESKLSQKNFSYENVIVKKDGKTVDLAWTGCWSEPDKAVFAIAHDMSEQKKIERLKREFVQMISHDLRSPLTAVQFFLELVTQGFYDEQGIENLKTKAATSEHDVARLIQLVNNLLDVEKMESGRMDVIPEMTPIFPLMQQSSDSVRNIAERKNVTLTAVNTDLLVYADGQQIVQVLVNLISNAVKFSPNGEKIEISAAPLEKFVEVRVKDNGRGIPAQVRDKIFNRFEQVELNDSRLKGGTGLGLAICKTIVEAHHGTIGVESEEGKGSIFWFRIPAEKWD